MHDSSIAAAKLLHGTLLELEDSYLKTNASLPIHIRMDGRRTATVRPLGIEEGLLAMYWSVDTSHNSS